MLARIPRVFNTRDVLLSHYRGRRIFGTTSSVLGNFGSCFVDRNRIICRGPDPNGGSNNVAALRSGDYNYIRGNNSTPVISILPCTNRTAGRNLGVLYNPNGSVISAATLATTNYRIVLFSANHKAPFNTPTPALGMFAGRHLYSRGTG